MLKSHKHRVRRMIRILSMTLVFLCLLSIYMSPVKAHRLSILVERINIVTSLRPECSIIDVDVRSIEILTLLGPTYLVGNISIKVYDPEGSLYVEGKSDDKARFSFELPVPPKPGRWRIVARYPSPLHTAVVDFYLERSIIPEEAPEAAPPVYMMVIAGLGYAIGVAGTVIGYVGWKAGKKRQ